MGAKFSQMSLRSTIKDVILSQPKPFEVSGARIVSNKLSSIFWSGSFFNILARTKSTNSWLLLVSQMPSHPIRMNSSSALSALFFDFWNSNDKLLIHAQRIILLVFKIADRATEIQISVYPTFADEATGLDHTILLHIQVRFMISAEFDSFATLRDNSTRITGVGYVQITVVNKSDVGSASCIGLLAEVIASVWLFRSILQLL